MDSFKIKINLVEFIMNYFVDRIKVDLKWKMVLLNQRRKCDYNCIESKMYICLRILFFGIQKFKYC